MPGKQNYFMEFLIKRKIENQFKWIMKKYFHKCKLYFGNQNCAYILIFVYINL